MSGMTILAGQCPGAGHECPDTNGNHKYRWTKLRCEKTVNQRYFPSYLLGQQLCEMSAVSVMVTGGLSYMYLTTRRR